MKKKETFWYKSRNARAIPKGQRGRWKRETHKRSRCQIRTGWNKISYYKVIIWASWGASYRVKYKKDEACCKWGPKLAVFQGSAAFLGRNCKPPMMTMTRTTIQQVTPLVRATTNACHFRYMTFFSNYSLSIQFDAIYFRSSWERKFFWVFQTQGRLNHSFIFEILQIPITVQFVQ